MKRVWYLLVMSVLLMSACSEQKEPPSVQPDIEEPTDFAEEPSETQTPYVFNADPSTFHFIADWMSDTQILYVEKSEGFYQLNYFDIETGETHLVYEDESFITDVLVHPSRQYLLIHTSEQANSAVVKMIQLDGTVQHQVEIDSTELAIEWNRSNPEKILFTAFYEDWSFDLFAFNGRDDNLSIVNLDDPFPKWAGDEWLMSMMFKGHPLDGGEAQLFQLDTGFIEPKNIENAIYFDIFEDSFVAVQVVDTEVFAYTIRDLEGTIISEWSLPSVSNYSEWVVPSIEWLDGKRMMFKGAAKSGQLDEMGTGFNLYHLEEGVPELLVQGLDASPLKCSPSGRYCLTGYTSDELIEVDAKKKYKWIEFDN
ncbi:hypothetical protein M3193_04300 [Sporosarcina luteola]|uniref:YqgU-like beta propeller domain-containing protein n=1 Tax=Sporosarcina luteola TaxID=582850 RepID=UPI0020423EAA|nr:hypothetical protein [Sporosarcina luteola]MCM3743351.1 hypothetical protein [Sporosarcina luteola]